MIRYLLPKDLMLKISPAYRNLESGNVFSLCSSAGGSLSLIVYDVVWHFPERGGPRERQIWVTPMAGRSQFSVLVHDHDLIAYVNRWARADTKPSRGV